MSFSPRVALRFLGAALLILTSACTTVTVTPEAAAPPAQQFHTIVVTLREPKDPKLVYLNSYFHDGLLRRLHELDAFDTILDKPPATATPDTLFVTATMIGASKGDELLRLFIGMGAGREHATAELDLTDSAGKSLGHIDVRKAYSGGAGIGGAGFIDLTALTTQVGEQAAQTLMDWSRGKNVSS